MPSFASHPAPDPEADIPHLLLSGAVESARQRIHEIDPEGRKALRQSLLRPPERLHGRRGTSKPVPVAHQLWRNGSPEAVRLVLAEELFDPSLPDIFGQRAPHLIAHADLVPVMASFVDLSAADDRGRWAVQDWLDNAPNCAQRKEFLDHCHQQGIESHPGLQTWMATMGLEARIEKRRPELNSVLTARKVAWALPAAPPAKHRSPRI